MTQLASALSQIIRAADPKAEARRILKAEASAKRKARSARRVKSKALQLPGKTKAERDAEKEAHRRETYDAVARRVDRERQGRCEWACEQRAEDPHHLLNGGRRSVDEEPATVAGICRLDHRGYEAGDEDALGRAWTWAHEHGFRKAQREIEHRQRKAAEARRS